MSQGKTKIVEPLWSGSEIALVTTKNDITAGDGTKHDLLPGKAELSTRTTCNIFEFLQEKNVPVAYIGRDGSTTFLTRFCEMIPVEIVVRLEADGSYLKRYPNVDKGYRFNQGELEFFYKTKGRRIGDQELPCDDPLMVIDVENWQIDLYRPDRPAEEGRIGPLNLPSEDIKTLIERLQSCGKLARGVAGHLELAWYRLQGRLVDFKIECGQQSDGQIVVADVIDCDSWRVWWKDIQLSKQGYRDGDDLGRVLGVYRLAASLTDYLV